MVDAYEISGLVAAAGVLVGVAYYVLDMRNQTKIRKMDLFIRLWTYGTTDQFMGALEKVNGLQFKDYEDYVKKYGSYLSENPMQRALWRVLAYFELLGTLYYDKLIDIKSVYKITGSYPKMLYERLKPIIIGIRKDMPEFVETFEYLANELTREEPKLVKMTKKIEQRLQKSNA
jgi:hypothetical protein